MPLYEYQCADCGAVSEYLIGVGSDQPDLSCGSCGSSTLEKKISLVSVSRGAVPETCCGGMGGSCDGGSCESHAHGTCACGG